MAENNQPNQSKDNTYRNASNSYYNNNPKQALSLQSDMFPDLKTTQDFNKCLPYNHNHRHMDIPNIQPNSIGRPQQGINYQNNLSLLNLMNYDTNTQEISHNESNINNDNLVLNYRTDKALYALDFHNIVNNRIALGSIEMTQENKIDIVEMKDDKMVCLHTEPHQYPISKILWNNDFANANLLASSSDIVRIYNFDEKEQNLKHRLNLSNKKSKYSDPLTAFDWNRVNNSIIGTASIDTTCTIWDVNKNTIRTQLIAHDKEVFDIAFSHDEHNFISAGADGSIRLFDLRNLEHSTIIYESKGQVPITKLSWNLQNSYYISAICHDKNIVHVIDSRNSTKKSKELKAHSAPVNSITWAPHTNSSICSVGEDRFVYIWDLYNINDKSTFGPFLQYQAPSEIRNVSWSESNHNWIGITFEKNLQLLKL